MLAGILVWLFSFALYLHGAGPGFTLEDSTELAVCVATLSNAHPPGFPWYILPGKLFILLPVGSPVFRLEIMSAVAGGLAVLAVYRVALVAATRAGFSRVEAVSGALAASALLATSTTLWWESSIAEKYPMFLALFGWSVYALFRFEESRSSRWLAGAFFLSGLAFGFHFQGLYLALPLAWAFYRAGNNRDRAVAGFLWILPVVTRFLYTPIRAVTGPVINWGVPDIFSRFIDYTLFRVYQSDRFILSGAGLSPSLVEAPSRLLVHLFLVPADEIGIAAFLSIAGMYAAWKWSRRVAGGVLALALLNLAVTINYRTSHFALYDLPLIWLLCALAGIGAAWAVQVWRPALALAPVIFVFGFIQHHDFSMRDRDYLASDHMRNLLACAPGDSIVVSGYDAWLFLPWYAREVSPQAAIQGLYVGALAWNDPERRTLDRVLGSRAGQLRYMQEGSAIYRVLARAASPRPVFCDFFSILLPSTGLRWRGILMEVPPEPAVVPFDARSADLAGKMRLRGMFRPRGGEEMYVARCYGIGFNAQGRAALAAGMNREALDLARRGLRIVPALPELHDLAARALFSLGRAREAEAEWRNALETARRAHQTWFEPFLGLASLYGRGKVDARLARLEYLKSAVLAGLGPRNRYAIMADRLRKEARYEEAEKVYKTAVAAIFDSYGRSYLAEMKLPQASRSWQDSLAWNPANIQVMFNLGQVAALEERFADSAVLCRKALAEAPPEARQEIADGMAKALANMERMKGLPALEKKLDAADPSPELMCDAGNIYWNLGRTRVAETMYRRSLAKAPRYARAWSNLGSALVEQRRNAEAVHAYEQAIDIDPGYSEAMLNLARVLSIEGKISQAGGWIERALESRPGWPEALSLKENLAHGGRPGQ